MDRKRLRSWIHPQASHRWIECPCSRGRRQKQNSCLWPVSPTRPQRRIVRAHSDQSLEPDQSDYHRVFTKAEPVGHRGQDHPKLSLDESQVPCQHLCDEQWPCPDARSWQRQNTDWVLQQELRKLQLESSIPCWFRAFQLLVGLREWQQGKAVASAGAVA